MKIELTKDLQDLIRCIETLSNCSIQVSLDKPEKSIWICNIPFIECKRVRL